MSFPLFRLRNRRGATMVELIAVLAIMSLGISALLQTIGGGIYYAKDTENNIKAINIAREGIEGMINIRDTNWLRFSSDKANCWKTQDYQVGCIGNTNNSSLTPSGSPAVTNILSGSYTIYTKNGAWFLSGANYTGPVNGTDYASAFRVGLDPLGFYTQSGVSSVPCSVFRQSSCRTVFTREMLIDVPTAQTGVLVVTSTVRWVDRRPQSVTLSTTLTNWRSRF